MPVNLVPPDRVDFARILIGECFFTHENTGKEYWIKTSDEDAMNIRHGSLKTIGRMRPCQPIKFTHTEINAYALEATDDIPRTTATRDFKPYPMFPFMPNNREVFAGACRYLDGPAEQARCVCYGDDGSVTIKTLPMNTCDVIALSGISIENFYAFHTITFELIRWVNKT